MRICKQWLAVTALCVAAVGCDGDDGQPGGKDGDVVDAVEEVAEQDAAGEVDEDAPLSDAGEDASTPDAASLDCAADPDACLYPSQGLEFTVREGYEVEDPVTGRSLPILARIPKGPGPFPVVVWSHGGGFSTTAHKQSVAWGSLLARHGYVVIHLAHTPPTTDTGLAVCAAASIPQADCSPDAGDPDDNPLLVVIRSYDLVAILDKLPALSKWSTDNGGPGLDLDRVAVAGWSAGSRAPVTLLGAVTHPSSNAPPFSMPDERVKAALMMSPTGPGFGGFYDEAGETSWDDLRGPSFFATGVHDVKPKKPELDGPSRRFGFDHQPASGSSYLLYSHLPVGTGGHDTYNLADAQSDDARLANLTLALGSAALAFLDAYLRDDAAALVWLQSDMAKQLAGDVDWENR